MPSLKLSVPDMRGRGCEQKLEAAYAGEPGVYCVVACATTRCLEIDFEDDEVTLMRLMEIARDTGYPASLAG